MHSRVFTAAILATVLVAFCGCARPSRPIDPIGHYVAGVILADASRYEDALAELTLAIVDDPELSVAYTAIGDVQFQRGHLWDAKKAYESACRVNPYSFFPHYKLGQVCTKLVGTVSTPDEVEKLLSSAVSWYQRSVELDPDDYDANMNLSNVYLRREMYSLSERYCKEAVRIKPDSAEAYKSMGTIYYGQKRFYDAIRWYDKSLELDSKQPELLMSLGTTYVSQKRWKPALNVYGMVASQQPKNAKPWVLIGTCYLSWGKLAEAEDAYKKALALAPDNYTAHRNLGTMYMMQFLGDTTQTDLRDKALEAWHRSLELHPNQEDIIKLVKKYTPDSAGVR